MRRILKRPAEYLLAHGGPAHLLRTWKRGELLVLAYHNIIPDGTRSPGERSLHLPRSVFVAQLERLRSSHEIVPLEEALNGTTTSGRPRAAITFDDAYAGAVGIGLEETGRRGIPATVFVSPAFIGGASFWWDVLAGGVGGEIPGVLRREFLSRLKGSDEAIRGWAAREGWPLREPPAWARAATLEDLDSAARLPGVTFGSHGWAHLDLATLSGSDLRAELERSLAWLRERFGRVIPWLSYPYGSFSPGVEEAAVEAGYLGAVTVTPGWTVSPPSRPLAVPRLNVPSGISPAGFTLQTAGLFRRG